MNFVEFEPNEIKITTKNGYPQGWGHQYNGVACSNVGIHKKLVTLGFSESKLFSPEWWYSLWHRIDGNGIKFVVEDVKKSFRYDQDGVAKEREHLENHKGRINLSQLAQLIEAELNTLNPAYKNFRILGEVTEAYLEVAFEYMGKYQNGFVLWENCD